MFAKDHIHPLTVAAHEKSALGLPRVTPADAQDLLNSNRTLQHLDRQQQHSVRSSQVEYLHRMTDETKGRRVPGTCAVGAAAVQQSIEQASVFTGLVTGLTAEERVGAVVEKHCKSAAVRIKWS